MSAHSLNFYSKSSAFGSDKAVIQSLLHAVNHTRKHPCLCLSAAICAGSYARRYICPPGTGPLHGQIPGSDPRTLPVFVDLPIIGYIFIPELSEQHSKLFHHIDFLSCNLSQLVLSLCLVSVVFFVFHLTSEL